VILWFYDLMIMIHNSYSSRTSHVYFIHVTICMHVHTVHDLLFCYSSRYCKTYWSFILTPYLYRHYIFMFLLLLFVSFLCTLAGPVLAVLYQFSISKSKSRYRRVDCRVYLGLVATLISLIFLFDLYYSDTVDDIIYNSAFHICVFISALDCICIYVCYPARN